jgi:hypothetical protein
MGKIFNFSAELLVAIQPKHAKVFAVGLKLQADTKEKLTRNTIAYTANADNWSPQMA